MKNMENEIKTSKEKQENKNNNELIIEKDHNKIRGFIIITILLLLLGSASIFYYFKIYNNPMVVIGRVLTNAKETLLVSNPKETNTFKLSASLDFDLDFQNQEFQEMANIINDIKFQYLQTVDYQNLYSVVNLHTKYQNQKLLNVKTILDLENENIYLNLEDLYDKYVKTRIDTSNFKPTQIDNNIIVNGICNALTKSITKDDFKRTSEETNVNGKVIQVFNNALIIDSSNYKRIMTTFIKELQNNDQFIKEIEKIYPTKNIKETMNDWLKEIENENYDSTTKISFYTKKTLKQELVKIDITEILDGKNTTISFTKVNQEIKINITSDAQEETTITIKKNNNSYIITSNINVDGNKLNFSINLSIENIDKVEKVDTSNYIEMNNLTEDDTNKILTNLMKNEALIKLINNINAITNKDI